MPGAEWRSVRQFWLKSVAIATSIEESQKVVGINNIQTYAFHLVLKIFKIGRVDPEIPLLNLKKN